MGNYIGVCHIHSVHSDDGLLSMPELAQFFKKRDYNFVCLTEHSPKDDGTFISSREMADIVHECKAVSDEKFVMIPGLECATFDDAHILAIGITEPIQSKDWNTIIDRIHAQGGYAVLAHPQFFERTYPREYLKMLDGIEVWNGKKSVNFPDISASIMLKKLRKNECVLSGIFGLDFHRPDNYRPLSIVISEDELSIKSVVRALKTGGFLLRSERFETGPLAEFSLGSRWKWYCMGWLFFKSHSLAKRIQSALEKMGIKIPEPLLRIPRKFYYH